MEGTNFSQGSQVTPEGVRYRVWAPSARQLVVCVWPAGVDPSAPPREVPLEPEKGGYHAGLDAGGRAGDRYLIRLDGSAPLPCPASRFQPDDVSGPAQVVDPRAYR